MAITNEDVLEYYLEHQGDMFEAQDKVIKINEENIPEDQRKQPELYLRWARLYAMAENKHDEFDEVISKTIWPQAKERAKMILEGKPSNAAVEEAAKFDEEYQEASWKRMRYKQLAKLLYEMKEAMKQRKDMLQSIGATQRIELDAIPRDLDSRLDAARKVLKNRAARRDDNGQ
jgi:hypothetical protein